MLKRARLPVIRPATRAAPTLEGTIEASQPDEDSGEPRAGRQSRLAEGRGVFRPLRGVCGVAASSPPIAEGFPSPGEAPGPNPLARAVRPCDAAEEKKAGGSRDCWPV